MDLFSSSATTLPWKKVKQAINSYNFFWNANCMFYTVYWAITLWWILWEWNGYCKEKNPLGMSVQQALEGRESVIETGTYPCSVPWAPYAHWSQDTLWSLAIPPFHLVKIRRGEAFCHSALAKQLSNMWKPGNLKYIYITFHKL